MENKKLLLSLDHVSACHCCFEELLDKTLAETPPEEKIKCARVKGEVGYNMRPLKHK